MIQRDKVPFSVLGTTFFIAESENNWVLLKQKNKEERKRETKGEKNRNEKSSAYDQHKQKICSKAESSLELWAWSIGLSFLQFNIACIIIN